MIVLEKQEIESLIDLNQMMDQIEAVSYTHLSIKAGAAEREVEEGSKDQRKGQRPEHDGIVSYSLYESVFQ